MALDDGDLGEVACGIGHGLPVAEGRLGDERPGHDLARLHADHPDPAVREGGEVPGGERPNADAAPHPIRSGDLRHVEHPAVGGDQPPALPHPNGAEAFDVGNGDNVGDIARRHRTVLVEPVVTGREQRRHHDRPVRLAAERNRLPHDVIDVALG